ncbi:Glucokinase [Dermatophilus congolensis]|uniref:Glucokinase n=2 Tax=Dermatophilus congolensis TaxID=1863 RepID=A0A239VQB7_9MICO|nr:Glucokinase [Dermatophilus congolensis]
MCDVEGLRKGLCQMSECLAVGIDIGGTKVSGGVVGEDGRILRRSRRHTPDRSKSPRVVEDTIVAVVDELTDGLEVSAVGIGAAGFVSVDGARVVFAPHLSWRNEPLRDSLAQRLGMRVHVENDANAALWAEYRFGCAAGESHVVMITLGTGIGGALLEEGGLRRGRYGIAGEYGHMQVVPDGRRCECGNRGCWEQYSSGNALVREAKALIENESPMSVELAARVQEAGGVLTGPLVTEAARNGDATAVELLAEVGQWLGVGMANLAAAVDPGLFVVGGGVSAAGDLLVEPAREMFAKKLTGRGYRPVAKVVAAALGNDAGLIGAADLARSETRG